MGLPAELEKNIPLCGGLLSELWPLAEKIQFQDILVYGKGTQFGLVKIQLVQWDL